MFGASCQIPSIHSNPFSLLPSATHHILIRQILDFFDEHPLVEYAFKEAVAIAADLAISGGDFVGVAVDHAKQWAIDGGTALATDYWQPFKAKMLSFSKTYLTETKKALADARGMLLDFFNLISALLSW